MVDNDRHTDPASPTVLPESTTWVCRFSAFESMSVSVIQGTPLQLFLLGQGAGPAALGLTVALFPLSMALQFPMALYLPRLGFPRTLAFGRQFRTALLAGLAAIGLGAGWLGGGVTIALAVVATGLFHALFSLAITARSPWWAGLAPQEVRGRFLARELLTANVSLVTSGLLVTAILRLETPLKFPLIFLLAALAGLVALRCIPRIPVIPVPPMPPIRHSLRDLRKTSLPRLMVYQMIAGLAGGGHSVIWIIVLRNRLHWDDHMINLMPLAASILIIPALPFLGRLLDQFGSRICLILAGLLNTLHLGLYAITASGFMPTSYLIGIAFTILLLQGTATISINLTNLASGRLVMGQVPPELQSIAAATMTLMGSILGALFPLGWGLIAEGFGQKEGIIWGWAWNGHSLLYVAMAILMAGSLILAARIQEPGSPSLRKTLRMGSLF